MGRAVGKVLYSTETTEMDENFLMKFFHEIGMKNCFAATPQQTYLLFLQEESQDVPPKFRLQSSLAYETSCMAYAKICKVTRESLGEPFSYKSSLGLDFSSQTYF